MGSTFSTGGAGGVGGTGLIQPSQFSTAPAGVQPASRQQNSFVPFFHTRPNGFTQLSVFLASWAKAGAAPMAAAANRTATLLSLFMVLLS